MFTVSGLIIYNFIFNEAQKSSVCEIPKDNLLEGENFMIRTLNPVSHGGLSSSEFKAISKLTTNSRTPS